MSGPRDLIVTHGSRAAVARLRRLAARGGAPGSRIETTVRRVIAQVRRRGDAALLRLTWRFDRVRLTAPRLRVPAAAMAAAYAAAIAAAGT